MVNALGNLLCMFCKAQMQIVKVEADNGINKYIFECLSCDRTRTIEVAPKNTEHQSNSLQHPEPSQASYIATIGANAIVRSLSSNYDEGAFLLIAARGS